MGVPLTHETEFGQAVADHLQHGAAAGFDGLHDAAFDAAYRQPEAAHAATDLQAHELDAAQDEWPALSVAAVLVFIAAVAASYFYPLGFV